MIEIKKVRSTGYPEEIIVTNTSVLIASNVKEYSETIDDHTMEGYEFDYKIYSKDEYIALMAQNSKKIAELEDELAATKILLGVE